MCVHRQIINTHNTREQKIYLCISQKCLSWKNLVVENKVLLRERKRHTARHVASARYAALSNGGEGGGAPSRPGWGGCTLGTPPSRPGMGVPPCPDLGWGTPPPSRPGMGYPPPLSRPGMGYPPYPDLGRGTRPGVKPTKQNWKTVPSLILGMRAVKNTCVSTDILTSKAVYFGTLYIVQLKKLRVWT